MVNDSGLLEVGNCMRADVVSPRQTLKKASLAEGRARPLRAS